MNTQAQMQGMIAANHRQSVSLSWTLVISATITPPSSKLLMVPFNSTCLISSPYSRVPVGTTPVIPIPSTITRHDPSPPRRRTVLTRRIRLRTVRTVQSSYHGGLVRFNHIPRPRPWDMYPVRQHTRCIIVPWRACPRRLPCSSLSATALQVRLTKRVTSNNR